MRKENRQTIFFTRFVCLELIVLTLQKYIKNTSILNRLPHNLRRLLLLALVLLGTAAAKAQVGNTVPAPRQDAAPADSVKVPQDSVKGDITTTIKYSARDSIVFQVKDRIVNMYGESSIDYGDISLKAAKTKINYQTNILSAEGDQDSTGKAVGTPVFKQGAEMYTSSQMNYNFKTKKGRISKVVTRQGEGFLHAQVVKRTDDEGAFYGAHTMYTTCDLPHPHFYINAPKIKAIPGKKIFTGPFNLVFADIPTPIGFLFGYFPTPSKRKSTGNSGIIFPTFGETREQGFYLRQGGYYLALNEYVGISLLGDIYTFGSWGATLQTQYSKRYAYRGNFSSSYSVTKYPDADEPTSLTTSPGRFPRQEPRTFWVQWSHTPAPGPGGQFSASVRAGSSFYNRQNMNGTNLNGNVSNRLSSTFNSSIQYQLANPNSPVTFTASMLQNQNVITRTQNFTLPEMTLTVNRQYPFRALSKKPTGGFFKDIAIGYNLTGRNQFTNAIQSGTLPGVNLIGGVPSDTVLKINPENIPTIMRNAQVGMQHSFPISMNSIRVLKHFSLSPSFNYSATSYFKELHYSFVESANAVRIDTVNKFSVASTYSAGASLTTRIYGMAQFKGKRLQAIRHQMTPFASYNYAPDLSTTYGDFVQISNMINSGTGMVPYQYLSRYNGFLFGTPSSTRQSVMSFGIQNNLEAKVKGKGDTATTSQKMSLIDNFSFSSGYNFAADSFRFQPINAQFRTMLFKRLSIFSSANFDPYQVNPAGRRIDRLMVDRSTFSFARLTNANLNLDFELNPEAFKKGGGASAKEKAPSTNRPSLETDAELRNTYVDFTIPWTFRTTYTASFFDNGQGHKQTTQSLGFDGSLSLTDKWQITYNSGYDFQNKGLTYTSLNIHRDLHCWEMSIGWVPFGIWQSYNISINARSSILRDLKVTRNRSWNNR
jgi:lipopolysaccharide assembly outer membrane protein LptD (OstA)